MVLSSLYERGSGTVFTAPFYTEINTLTISLLVWFSGALPDPICWPITLEEKSLSVKCLRKRARVEPILYASPEDEGLTDGRTDGKNF